MKWVAQHLASLSHQGKGLYTYFQENNRLYYG